LADTATINRLEVAVCRLVSSGSRNGTVCGIPWTRYWTLGVSQNHFNWLYSKWSYVTPRATKKQNDRSTHAPGFLCHVSQQV